MIAGSDVLRLGCVRKPITPGSVLPDGGATDRLAAIMDWRLELVQIPVADVDRAKTFYTEKAGFNADVDATVGNGIRFVQLTPPGSPTSIALGTGLADMRPGSVQGMQLVVPDINAARAELVRRGVEVSGVQEFDWGSFVFFSDPDGNGWAVQQLPARD
jgi:predicted enzyme related to lactoylglutathione lyase